MIFLRYLLFFPSITFGLISAEVFPYAIIYSLFYSFKTKISIWVIIAFFLILISGLNTFSTAGQADLQYETIRSTLAYINPLFMFAILLNVDQFEIDKLYNIGKKLFVLMIFLSIIQYSGAISSLDTLFKFLVPRASADVLGFRGVTLLATEPARASIEFTFLYLLFRVQWNKSLYNYISDALILMIMVVVFKSAMGVFVYVCYLAIFNIKFLLILIPASLLFVEVFSSTIDLGRFYDLFVRVYSMPIAESLYWLMNTSGNRIVSVIAAVYFALKYPFGGGVGNWKESSEVALKLTGIDPSTLEYFTVPWNVGVLYFRASGYVTNLMMDLGFVGGALMLMLIVHLVYPFLVGSRVNKKIFCLFIINILFIGSVGTPVVWMVTALILRNQKEIQYSC